MKILEAIDIKVEVRIFLIINIIVKIKVVKVLILVNIKKLITFSNLLSLVKFYIRFFWQDITEVV